MEKKTTWRTPPAPIPETEITKTLESEVVVVGVSKDSKNRPMFLRLKMIPNVTTKALRNVVDQCVQKGSTIECDGYRSYPGLENVTVDASKYEPGDLKWAHTAIGNFKSFLLGTYHGNCGDYQPCLDEFCFRF